MKRTKKETETENEFQENPFSFGLQIDLHDDELKKLGIDVMPPVGTEVKVGAKAKIVSVREEELVDGKMDRHLRIQITDLELFGADGKTAAEILYGDLKA